jgi:hypothetical protein
MLDYSNSPTSRRSNLASETCQVKEHDTDPIATTLSYREVLLSPPRATHKPQDSQVLAQEANSYGVASPSSLRPMIHSILVCHERESQHPPPRDHSGRLAADSVKASGHGERCAKKVPATTPSHGWQEVRRKVWRKKPADQPRQHRRLIHERLQHPAGLEKQAREETKQ